MNHDAIDWLAYQLMLLGEVELYDFKKARTGNLRSFDWTIFDVEGHSLTENDVLSKIGGRWVVGRAIVRLELGTASVARISGTKLIDLGAPASEYLEIIEGVRA